MTDQSGAYELPDGSGSLVIQGGTDSATGLPFAGTLLAPAGSFTISPLTTLIETLLPQGGNADPATVDAANDIVVAALGLAAGTDLTTLDAEAGTLSGDFNATQAFVAQSEVQNIEDLIAAAGGSGSGALAALASGIASGTSVDLTSSATVTALAVAGGLQPAAAMAVAVVVTSTDAALAQQLATASDPTSVFLDITGASRAEQGTATSAIANALASGGVAAVAAVATTYAQTAASTLSAAIATVTSSSTLPTIAGTVANQAVADKATAKPFAGVTITDPGASAQETLLITVNVVGAASDADGFLSGSDLTEVTPGIYRLVESSPAALTSALDALTFTPTLHQVSPGQSVTTDFTLAVTDGIAPEIDDSTTSVVATASGIHLVAPSLSLTYDTGSSATDKITSDPTITYTPSQTSDTLLYAADGGAFSALVRSSRPTARIRYRSKSRTPSATRAPPRA